MNLKEYLFKKLKKQNVFWSYDVNSISDINDSILIEYTLIYADVDEIKNLFLIFNKKVIKKVWDEKIVPDKRYIKLNYFLGKFFFNIKNINIYIKEKSIINSRYEKLKLLSSKY